MTMTMTLKSMKKAVMNRVYREYCRVSIT